MLICLENLVMEPQQRKFAKEGNKLFYTVMPEGEKHWGGQ